MSTQWPHAPLHMLSEKGTYIVTAATYQKVSYFQTSDRLDFLQDTLLKLALEYKWNLQAWAVLSNHYHFVAESPQDPTTLSSFLSQLHVTTARYVNTKDNTPNRRVWWRYWDSRITYPHSYLARLNYVNQNPVRHGLVSLATQYPWCSASWFEKTVSEAFCKTVASFRTDTVKVIDDF